MKREEEIIDAGIEYTLSHHPVCIGGGAFADAMREFNRSAAFEAGARWADSNPSKGTSLIKWQTGEPKEYGKYLVSTVDGDIMIDTYFLCNSAKDLWLWVNNSNEDISAWCKLDDIEEPVL